MNKRVKTLLFTALLLCYICACGVRNGKGAHADPPRGTSQYPAAENGDKGFSEPAQDSGQKKYPASDYRIVRTPPAPFCAMGIRLFGGSVMEVDRGETWKDPGAAPYDAYAKYGDGTVDVAGELDTDICGRYELRYSLTDETGNELEAVRTVYVRPNEQDIEEAEERGKLIYLTFDDGTSDYTARLLDILKKYNVKATFFVVNMGRYHLFSRELEEGHTLAIHSYSHDFSKIYASEEAFFEDVSKMRQIIYRQTGFAPTMIRFPGGSSNAASKAYSEGIMTRLTQEVGERGYIYFDWNVSCGDGNPDIDTERIIENVKSGVSKHRISVLLMHESHGYTVDAVEEIIVWALENGYTFMPLSKYSYKAHHAVCN